MAKIYTPVSGIGSGRGSAQIAVRSRMYQGPDHLLVVQSTGYTEEYKRIFYRDIRYIDVRPNRRQLWHGLISGAFVLFFGLLFFSRVPAVALQILGLPFLVWFVVNLILGPGCDCYARTSVQTLQIPAPRRMKKVPRLIEFLRAQTAAAEPVPSAPAVA